MKDFYKQKGKEQGKLNKAKKQTGYSKGTFLQGMAEVYQAGPLTGAYQALPDRLV